MNPELTKLGITATEAADLLDAHQHVLRQLEVGSPKDIYGFRKN